MGQAVFCLRKFLYCQTRIDFRVVSGWFYKAMPYHQPACHVPLNLIEEKMKKIIITVAAFGLFCSPALAMDKCEIEIEEMIKKLKETEKIMDQSKQKYIPQLEEALKLCRAGDLEKSGDKINTLQDEFFRDTLYNQQKFFGS
jgi:hypothetical protein